MLFLREMHEVGGAHEREFERLYRQAWMPALATSAGGRLLDSCAPGQDSNLFGFVPARGAREPMPTTDSVAEAGA